MIQLKKNQQFVYKGGSEMKETLGSSVTEFIAQDKKNYATEGA